MITRDTKNGLLGGVCAGLADWMGVDPLLLRIVFILTALFYGAAVLVYLVLWLIMPPQTST